MNRPVVLLVATGVALTLAGCASAAQPAATPTPTQDPALAFCEVLIPEMSAYTAFVADTASGSVDVPEAKRLIVWADAATAASPAQTTSDVADLFGPLRQIEDVIAAGGGPLSFSTTTYKAANLKVISYCADAGFKL